MSFGPLAQDQLLVVLNRNNNYQYKSTLNIPIQQVERCRILSSEIVMIRANFLQNSYLYVREKNIPDLESGIAITGDHRTYYKINTNFITDIQVSLFENELSKIKNDSYTILFQFI
jgi:hypothetical protein